MDVDSLDWAGYRPSARRLYVFYVLCSAAQLVLIVILMSVFWSG